MKIYAVRELLTLAERSDQREQARPGERGLDVRIEVRVGGKPVELEIEDIAVRYPSGDNSKKPHVVLTTRAVDEVPSYLCTEEAEP